MASIAELLKSKSDSRMLRVIDADGEELGQMTWVDAINKYSLSVRVKEHAFTAIRPSAMLLKPGQDSIRLEYVLSDDIDSLDLPRREKARLKDDYRRIEVQNPSGDKLGTFYKFDVLERFSFEARASIGAYSSLPQVANEDKNFTLTSPCKLVPINLDIRASYRLRLALQAAGEDIDAVQTIISKPIRVVDHQGNFVAMYSWENLKKHYGTDWEYRGGELVLGKVATEELRLRREGSSSGSMHSRSTNQTFSTPAKRTPPDPSVETRKKAKRYEWVSEDYEKRLAATVEGLEAQLTQARVNRPQKKRIKPNPTKSDTEKTADTGVQAKQYDAEENRLRRMSIIDESLIGYDAETVNVVKKLLYDGCTAAEQRVNEEVAEMPSLYADVKPFERIKRCALALANIYERESGKNIDALLDEAHLFVFDDDCWWVARECSKKLERIPYPVCLVEDVLVWEAGERIRSRVLSPNADEAEAMKLLSYVVNECTSVASSRRTQYVAKATLLPPTNDYSSPSTIKSGSSTSPRGKRSVSSKRHAPKQHQRRGHWRNQPYGEGGRLRKRIWISSTLVTPSGAFRRFSNPSRIHYVTLSASEVG